MAIRGAKPTATHLKLVTGNPGKRPLVEGEPEPAGAPIRPAWLRVKRALALWGELTRIAFWLTEADSYKLAAWCDRQADFEIATRRKKWTAADRREHRSLGSELGLDPSSRARLGTVSGAAKKDKADQYF